MNYLCCYLMAESCQRVKMMISAAFVQMVGIFSFAISVLGPSTKVLTLSRIFQFRTLVVLFKVSCIQRCVKEIARTYCGDWHL